MEQNTEEKPNHFVAKGIKRAIDDNAFYHSQKEYVSSSCLKSIAKRSVYHYVNSEPMGTECFKNLSTDR